MATEQKRILTTRDLAAHLSLDKQTLENWRISGRGPRYFKMGAGSKAHVRYRLDDVLAWEDSQPHVDPSTQRRALEEAEKVA